MAHDAGVCVPGSEQGCECDDGAEGQRFCREDGQGFTGCQCPNPVDPDAACSERSVSIASELCTRSSSHIHHYNSI